MPIEDIVRFDQRDALEYVKLFQEQFPEIYRMMFVPEPKRGGTFFYCSQLVERDVPKLDKNGRKTRYTTSEEVACAKKFRILKRYRRHWRRSHASA
jgi:hypothetical protein